jgi:hypothetical protein
MCILLCANPHVYQWLDLDVALACRDSLQLSPVCQVDPLTRAEIVEIECLDEGAVQKLARGPVLRQPRSRRRDEIGDRSSYEWKNPLDTLANAWSRLLSLVGWLR